MIRVLLFFSVVLFVGVVPFGCEKIMQYQNEAERRNEVTPLRKLFFELEQKYKREMYKNGFALHYAPFEPDTIIITLTIPADSNKRSKAMEVMYAAKRFTKSIARKKYNFSVKVETVVVDE